MEPSETYPGSMVEKDITIREISLKCAFVGEV